jgi:recombination associated protein RdgC
MGFESGSASFRAFYLQHPLPSDMVQRVAKNTLPPLKFIGRNDLNGWVAGRHLLDREITEDTALVAGYLRLILVKAERKIPEALLKAECTMEELALMQAEHKAFLNRAERAKIKKEVSERLLPQMPPTLTGIPVVADPGNRMAYAGATTDKRLDAFVVNFEACAGFAPIPVTAATAAMKRQKVNIKDVEPASFSPELEDKLAGDQIGQDFLTWLWFYSEARQGLLDIEGDTYGAIVEGPLTFVLEGDGAHVAQLRNGMPLMASEAKTALLSGKKLQRARVTVSRAGETWTTGFNADQFTFSGFKFPENKERVDAYSLFQTRMLQLNRFTNAFLSYYDKFLLERAEPKKWKAVQKDIFQWVQNRASRK